MKNGDKQVTPNYQMIDNGYGQLVHQDESSEYGLTKREYFAGLAMQGILASGPKNIEELMVWLDTVKTFEHSDVAIESIKIADALLKELDK